MSRSNPFQANGASANRTRGLLEGLISQGGEIHFYILAPFFSRNDKLAYLNFQQNSPSGLKLIYLSSILFGNAYLERFYRYLLSYFFEIIFAFKLKKVLSDFNGVVFTSPDYYLMKQLYKLKKKNPKLIIICEISEYLDYYKSQDIPKWLLPQLIRTEKFFVNQFVSCLSGCVVMTKALYRFFEELNLSNVKLLHLPMTVDLSRFENPQKTSLNFKKPYVLFVGVMNNAKDGVDVLIDSFFEINTKFPEYNLYLVGPWQYDTPGHLEKIKALGLTGKVYWINEVQRDEIPPLLKEASLLVLPRPDSKQAQGGFPTKLGEYLASGVPVCATSVGEIPDYLTDNETVFFAEPGSVTSFASAMTRAFEDYDKAIIVGKNGRKVAEEFFNKDIQSKTLYNFLEEFIINSNLNKK